jgi:mono/diheme cytochrome c family protein
MKKMIVLSVAVGFAAVLTANAGDAKEIYAKDCAKCHGEDGKGQTKMGQKIGAKDWADAKVQAELNDDGMAKAIKEGIRDADGKLKMKAYGETISDEEIKGLVQVVRSFKK